jgi:hypothetical protein
MLYWQAVTVDERCHVFEDHELVFLMYNDQSELGQQVRGPTMHFTLSGKFA